LGLKYFVHVAFCLTYSGCTPFTSPVVVDVMEWVIIVVDSVSDSLDSIISTYGCNPSTSPVLVDEMEWVIIVVGSVSDSLDKS
jgi:hypothetical protein